jgi:transposase
MNKPAMTSCCVFCIQMAYTVLVAIRFLPIRRPIDGDDRSFPITTVGSAARSSTCSASQSSGRPAIVVPLSFRSCVASLKASQLSIWPTNWPSIALISWNDGTRYKRSWPRIFPPTAPLSDPVTEADELYQNAGEKGRKHADPADPPRRRANQARGHGTWASDRPPIVGIVGRLSGHIRLRVCKRADRATLEPLVITHTRPDAIVNTDEWSAYYQLAASGRTHQTVCHTPGQREWARDDDGDGIREVHNNTMEGIWTGCRNFLRLFRGVSKWFLAGYVVVFECAHNLKWVTPTLVRAMMTPSTTQPT